METIVTLFDTMRSMIVTISLADILDILVVALLIYGILTQVKSSSALRIVSAVAIFLLVTGLTSVVKMRVLNFILSKVLEIGFVALVVVFQPELRRGLERLGTRSLVLLTNQKGRTNVEEQVISRTVTACDIMSRERTGVLIVFEREMALDDYFKTGTIIDAEVSTELLRNLFFTKASLHDGAVVIRADRIAAAGCVLPLTDSTSISSDLGTRHRAGIGMSEASDAVVVIVSEETGAISVAVGGMLKRSLSPDTLKKILMSELHNEEDTEQNGLIQKIQRWLLQHSRSDRGDKHEEK